MPLVRDSDWLCPPPLLQPYPSRMMSPSPEHERGLPKLCCFNCRPGVCSLPAWGLPSHCCRCGRPCACLSPVWVLSCHFRHNAPITRAWPQGGRESKWIVCSRKHHWSWAKEPVVWPFVTRLTTRASFYGWRHLLYVDRLR